MNRPVFHPDTALTFERLSRQLPHAMLLHGKKGVGLLTAASHLARQAGATVEIVYPERLDAVDIERGRISIDIVRRLYDMTRTRVATPRCIIITAADTMSIEAQNAFLKLLEEPVQHVSFMLLAHASDRLLPTIRSRVQALRVSPVTREQSALLLDRLQVNDATKRNQLLFMAEGLPARLSQLAQDEAYFDAEAALLRSARSFIQGSAYERLAIIQSIKDSRDNAEKLIDYAMTIVHYDITTKRSADDGSLRLLDQLEHAAERLGGNAHIRLALGVAALA